MRKIVNLDADRFMVCSWGECDRNAIQLYTHVQCNHPVQWPCTRAQWIAVSHGEPGAHTRFAFCSHRHMAYFVESQGWRALRLIEQTGRGYGNLPTGSKNLPL